MSKIHVQTTINEEATEFLCEPRESLLEVLRETLGFTGTSSVTLDGVLIDSCLMLAVEAEGKSISTVEGLANPEGLHPIQQAFLEHAALQCGICTPGFLVASKALLDHNPEPSEHEIRHWLAGNLCRCTGYDKIVRAVLEAAQTVRASA